MPTRDPEPGQGSDLLDTCGCMSRVASTTQVDGRKSFSTRDLLLVIFIHSFKTNMRLDTSQYIPMKMMGQARCERGSLMTFLIRLTWSHDPTLPRPGQYPASHWSDKHSSRLLLALIWSHDWLTGQGEISERGDHGVKPIIMLVV